jgi:transketolase
LEIATQRKQQPSVIIANTVKGKGVSYMEHDNSWHQKAPTKEQFEIALRELGGEANE